MVLGGGALERWLGHEGSALMNGISALMKETPPQRAPLLFLPYEDMWKDIYEPENRSNQTLNLQVP